MDNTMTLIDMVNQLKGMIDSIEFKCLTEDNQVVSCAFHKSVLDLERVKNTLVAIDRHQSFSNKNTDFELVNKVMSIFQREVENADEDDSGENGDECDCWGCRQERMTRTEKE